jgi:hypothetical protein
MLPYKVAAKYAKGPEQLVAKFDKQDEAKEYIEQKLQKDAAMKVNVTYLLYDTGELLASYDQSNANDESGLGGGQQKASTQSFRPTPLQTTLRPTGMPPSSFKNDDDDKKK